MLPRKDAPVWSAPWFKAVPAETKAARLTLAGDDYSGQTYFALFSDHQIWYCPRNFKSELEHMLQSRAAVWLSIPAVLGVACTAWFMKLFIDHGSPTQWGLWGRDTRIKQESRFKVQVIRDWWRMGGYG